MNDATLKAFQSLDDCMIAVARSAQDVCSEALPHPMNEHWIVPADAMASLRKALRDWSAASDAYLTAARAETVGERR